MDKILKLNQKGANKQPKSKKKQPLKVVYITNPIKFKVSASEFKALVQRLTGQDADLSESSTFSVDDGVSGSREEVADVAEVAEVDNVHAKIGSTSGDYGEVVQNGLDSWTYGSIHDADNSVFSNPIMMENFPELEDSNLWHEAAHVDVLKSLDAM